MKIKLLEEKSNQHVKLKDIPIGGFFTFNDQHHWDEKQVDYIFQKIAIAPNVELGSYHKLDHIFAVNIYKQEVSFFSSDPNTLVRRLYQHDNLLISKYPES